MEMRGSSECDTIAGANCVRLSVAVFEEEDMLGADGLSTDLGIGRAVVVGGELESSSPGSA